MELNQIFAQTEELDSILSEQEMAFIEGGKVDPTKIGCDTGGRCKSGGSCSGGSLCKNGGIQVQQRVVSAW